MAFNMTNYREEVTRLDIYSCRFVWTVSALETHNALQSMIL